jgi:hypothetical protein
MLSRHQERVAVKERPGVEECERGLIVEDHV